jgi:hypothetical protein
MNPRAVLHVTDTAWRLLDANAVVEDAAPWLRLDQPTIAVLDLESIYTEVGRFEGKPEYARAIIEKRVRSEGLVDGVAHVVVHHLVPFSGGFQAFYSAMPLDVWQPLSAWAARQKDHCGLVTAAGLLTLGASERQATALVSDRGWQIYAPGPTQLVYLSVRAAPRPDEPNAVQTLGALWKRAGTGIEQVLLGSLGLPEEAAYTTLASMLAEATETSVHTRPAVRYRGDHGSTGNWVSSLPQLVRQTSAKHLLNPGLAKLAWQAESWIGTLTGLTLLGAGGLFALAVHAQTQTQALQAETSRLQQQTQEVEQRITRLASAEPPATLLEAADFAYSLRQGQKLDPLQLLQDLRRHDRRELRVQRVRLEPLPDGKGRYFRVEGTAPIGESTAVLAWVQGMEASGWSLRAIDPSDTQPGAWAYEVSRRPSQTASGSPA